MKITEPQDMPKVVVITGASAGLGKEIALRLSQGDGQLVLIARNGKKLEQVQQRIHQKGALLPMILPCDIADESAVKQTVQRITSRFSTVDVLINNAGTATYQTVEKLPSWQMREQFEVNFFGVFYLTQQLLPYLRRSRNGYILNIGSAFGKTAWAENSVYAATKHALVGFTEGLRQEVKKQGIAVGLFSPGPMNTPFQQKRGGGSKVPPFLMKEPTEAAAMVKKMVRKRAQSVQWPRWMVPILRLKKNVS